MFKTLKVFKNIKFTKLVKRGDIKTVVLKLSGLFRYQILVLRGKKCKYIM